MRNKIAQVCDTFVGQCLISDKDAKLDVVVPRSQGQIGRSDEDALGVGDNQFGMKAAAILAAHGARIIVYARTPRARPSLPESVGELSYNPSIRTVIALVARYVDNQVGS